MIHETQANILRSIAEIVLSEVSGNWKLYATYRPTAEKDDLLTKDNECCILNSEEKLDRYLSSRIASYDANIGMFVDVACETVDKDGELAGELHWCNVGFANENMDLIVDVDGKHEVLVIRDFCLNDAQKAIELLTQEVFKASDGYAAFIDKEFA